MPTVLSKPSSAPVYWPAAAVAGRRWKRAAAPAARRASWRRVKQTMIAWRGPGGWLRGAGTDGTASEFPAKGAGNPWQSRQSPGAHFNLPMMHRPNPAAGRLWLAACALLAVFLLQIFFASLVKSPVADEPGHISAGLSYVETGLFRANLQHPPLIKELSGLVLKL